LTKEFTLTDIDHKLIELALEEDLSVDYIDCTTDKLFMSHNHQATARVINKQNKPIVVCGMVVVEQLFKILNIDYLIQPLHSDGDTVSPGDEIFSVHTDTGSILRLERTILNFLRHLSGVSTLTAEFTSKIKDYQTKILDTRKTTPGMRHLEKYATKCGGAVNHRFGLYDEMMIKDTHIDALGGMAETLSILAQQENTNHKVTVEVRHQNELKTLIEYGKNIVDQVLLDNMTIAELAKCVDLAKPYFITEASGNLNLQTIIDIAKTGVDYASVGQITHSAPQVDLAMVMI